MKIFFTGAVYLISKFIHYNQNYSLHIMFFRLYILESLTEFPINTLQWNFHYKIASIWRKQITVTKFLDNCIKWTRFHNLDLNKIYLNFPVLLEEHCVLINFSAQQSISNFSNRKWWANTLYNPRILHLLTNEIK